MMKLTLTLELESASSSKGSGVVSACGGCSAPHSARAAGCIMEANSESCTAELHTRLSRCASEACPPFTCSGTDWIDARHNAGTETIQIRIHVRTSMFLVYLSG